MTTYNFSYFGSFLQDLIFFSGDVKTTTIAIAITSSLCASIILLIISLLNGENISFVSLLYNKKQEEELLNDGGGSRKETVVTFHLNRRSQQGSHFSSLQKSNSYKSIWADRIIEKECSVPCLGCGVKWTDHVCRYVFCKSCCHSNRDTKCQQHHFSNNIVCDLPRISWESPKTRHPECTDKPTEIDLSYLNLKHCPNRVGFMGSQLVTLNLSNNHLHSLPLEIGCLLGLQHLYLHYNCLKTLPESIGSLSHLLCLNVKNNHLKQLPHSIGRLNNLVNLVLNNNHLKALPNSIGQLSQLLELTAHCNQIEELPNTIGNLTKLKRLLVGENRLVELPGTLGQLVRLEEFGISSCQLSSLPYALTWCTSLKRLWASYNRIHYLPSPVGRLHQLQELHLMHNQLKYLPASIHALRLFTLSVSGNPLLEESQTKRCEIYAPSAGFKNKFPPLLELTARNIIKQKLKFKNKNLPWVLEAMLTYVHYCASCEGPLFDHFRGELLFHNIALYRLPLYQQHLVKSFYDKYYSVIQITIPCSG